MAASSHCRSGTSPEINDFIDEVDRRPYFWEQYTLCTKKKKTMKKFGYTNISKKVVSRWQKSHLLTSELATDEEVRLLGPFIGYFGLSKLLRDNSK